MELTFQLPVRVHSQYQYDLQPSTHYPLPNTQYHYLSETVWNQYRIRLRSFRAMILSMNRALTAHHIVRFFAIYGSLVKLRFPSLSHFRPGLDGLLGKISAPLSHTDKEHRQGGRASTSNSNSLSHRTSSSTSTILLL